MKLKPLEEWICDKCSQVIEGPENGYMEWIHFAGKKAYGFKIVHHGGECYHYNHHEGRSDSSLDDFIGDKGLTTLLSMIHPGKRHMPDSNEVQIENPVEFLEVVRRLHIPYFEEARLYWSNAQEHGFFDGANEVWLYLPNTLKNIIDKFGE